MSANRMLVKYALAAIRRGTDKGRAAGFDCGLGAATIELMAPSLCPQENFIRYA